MSASRPIRWGWVALAAAVVLVVAALTGVQYGSCATGADYSCATEPLGGWPSAWVRIVLGLMIVVYALYRATRKKR